MRPNQVHDDDDDDNSREERERKKRKYYIFYPLRKRCPTRDTRLSVNQERKKKVVKEVGR